MQMYEQFLNHHGETKYKNLGKNERKFHKMLTHTHVHTQTRVLWLMSVIPALRSLRQEDCLTFENSLNYMSSRPA